MTMSSWRAETFKRECELVPEPAGGQTVKRDALNYVDDTLTIYMCIMCVYPCGAFMACLRRQPERTVVADEVCFVLHDLRVCVCVCVCMCVHARTQGHVDKNVKKMLKICVHRSACICAAVKEYVHTYTCLPLRSAKTKERDKKGQLLFRSVERFDWLVRRAMGHNHRDVLYWLGRWRTRWECLRCSFVRAASLIIACAKYLVVAEIL